MAAATFSRTCLNMSNGLCLLSILMIIHSKAMKSTCLDNFDFVTQPNNVTVREGEPASFECTLQSRVPFTSVSSYWINGKTENVRQQPFVNITTIPLTAQKQVTSRLKIQRVQREINTLYRCSIIIHDLSGKILSSGFGRLDVLYFLRENDLHCKGPESTVLEEGDQLAIRCEGSGSNPPVLLTWLWPSSTSLSTSFVPQAAEYILTSNITVTRLIHNKVIFCIATSMDFPGESVNCTLGPFKVIHSPVVEVFPHQSEMRWPLETDMFFQCLTTGYPEVGGYNWSCSPAKAFAQCTSQWPNLTIVVNPVRDEEVLNVICEAWNSIEKAESKSIVTIRHGDKSLLPNCDSDYTQEQNLEKGIFLEYTRMHGGIDYLKCSTKVKSTGNITFRWSLDGIANSEEKGNFMLHKNDMEGTDIFAYSTHEPAHPGILTCDFESLLSGEPKLYQISCYVVADTFDDPRKTTDLETIQRIDSSTTIPSIEISGLTNNVTKLSTTSHDSKTFWNIFLMVAVAIAVVLGILLCSIAIALGWKRLTATGRYDAQQSVSGLHQADMSNDIPSAETKHAVCQMNSSPLYEVPNERLTIPILSKNNPFPNVSWSGDRNERQRRGHSDSMYEGEGSSTDRPRSGCSSSSSDLRMSYMYEDSEENGAVDHYENRQVVESMIGNVGSKYFAKVIENHRIRRLEDNQERSDDENSSSMSE